MIDRIGIVGGGQLGRMLTLAALPLGFEVSVLDPTPGCPAAQVGASHIAGRLDDPTALARLAAVSDVVTWEIEHLDAAALVELESSGTVVRPSPSMLEVVQDKFVQKALLRDGGVPVPDTVAFPDVTDPARRASWLEQVLDELGSPVVVKTRRGGYDGRGNHVCDGDLDALEAALGSDWGNLYAERHVDFDAELAVVAARGVTGEVVTYPTVRTVQRRSICHTASTPAGLDPALEEEAQDVARRTMALLDGPGVFAVEMFLAGGRVLANEVAPRVHNSGHLTIEANATSQFEQHVRAVSGLPLGSTAPRAPAAAMVNLLGVHDGPLGRDALVAALGAVDVHVHLYGKASRPERKIGHVTALAPDPASALRSATDAAAVILR